MKRLFWFLLLSIVAIVVLYFVLWLAGATISPLQKTLTSLSATTLRIYMYLCERRQFPTSIEELPKRKGYANCIEDGWGRKLIYTIEKDQIFSLSSLGKDGVVGGTGDNKDITRKYRVKRIDGSWTIDDKFWFTTHRLK